MIKKLGLGGGLALGGSLILGGILMMSAGSPEAGGGIMIVLGMLFLVVPGVLILGLTLLGRAPDPVPWRVRTGEP